MLSPESPIISQPTDFLARFIEKQVPETASKIIVQSTDIFIQKQLPNSFENFTMVHVSDNHNTDPFEKHTHLADEIEKSHPDAMFISGDLTDKSNYDKSLQFIHKSKEIIGGYDKIYIVTGNHDFLQIPPSRELEVSNFFKYLSQLGCHVLHNEFIELQHNDGFIYIVGIDDPTMITYYNSINSIDEIEYIADTVQEKFKNIDSNKCSLLITHRPEKFSQYLNADAVFCGHAHGGQMRFFDHGLIAPHQGLNPKYSKGIHQEGKTTMLISPGVSQTMNVPRFNNPGVIYIGHLTSQIT